MTQEQREKMNALARAMNDLAMGFRLDPDNDAQYLSGTIAQAIAGMNMRLSNQWGEKLDTRPVPPPVVEVPVEVVEEAPAPKPKKAPAKKK